MVTSLPLVRLPNKLARRVFLQRHGLSDSARGTAPADLRDADIDQAVGGAVSLGRGADTSAFGSGGGPIGTMITDGTSNTFRDGGGIANAAPRQPQG